MKTILVAAIAVIGLQANAKTQFCLAGKTDAAGKVNQMSGNDTQVIVLKDGQVSAHTLKDPFILFNNNYNINNPLDMNWVSNMGKCGSYNQSATVAAKWQVKTDGTIRTVIDFKADSESLKGHADTDQFFEANGGWAGSTMDDMICSNSGLKNEGNLCN
jgi:hypothetical protein